MSTLSEEITNIILLYGGKILCISGLHNIVKMKDRRGALSGVLQTCLRLCERITTCVILEHRLVVLAESL